MQRARELCSLPSGPAELALARAAAARVGAGLEVSRPGTPRPVVTRLAAGAFALAIVGSGCGPSFEAIAEGDLRFAHCDRLDLDDGIAHSHRLHCWREWRRVYTYGQTRDRVEYAQRRIAVLASGDTSKPFDIQLGPPAKSEQPSLPLGSAKVALSSRCPNVCADRLAECRKRCSEEGATTCARCQQEVAHCRSRCP